MIKPDVKPAPIPPWREELRTAIRDPATLSARLELAPEQTSSAALQDFKLLVPEAFLARIHPRDPRDPLLLQVLPRQDEVGPQPPDFVADPLGECGTTRVPGLLTKYHGRALLVTNSACAVHCRYCFRRHFPYATDNPRRDGWAQALGAIAADSSIGEVILSGGDPLMLDEADLGVLTRGLAAIKHVKRLRIHTRLPVIIPHRVNSELIAWLHSIPLPVTLVMHVNHPNEIDVNFSTACSRLRPHVQFMLNQAVLLAGVNDNVMALERLCLRLSDCGVLPYYLHLLDHVAGTAHFLVAEPRARTLIETLRERLPGYLVPRLAREKPGARSKHVLA